MAVDRDDPAAGALSATGTPEAVGNEMTPPEYLQAGDLVEARVGGIGAQRNQVAATGRG